MGPGLGMGLCPVTADGGRERGPQEGGSPVCAEIPETWPSTSAPPPQGPLCLSHAAPKLPLPQGPPQGDETPPSLPPSAQ